MPAAFSRAQSHPSHWGATRAWAREVNRVRSKFITRPAVEAFHENVRDRLTQIDVAPIDTPRPLGLAAASDQQIEFLSLPPASEPDVRDGPQALAGANVEDCKNAEVVPRLIGNKIHS